MKRPAALVGLLLVTLFVISTHLSWEQADNGSLLIVDGNRLDIIGIARNKWNRLSRDCRDVARLNASELPYRQADEAIRAYSPPNSASARIAGAWQQDEWLLVEVEFDDLLPAVVLLKKRTSGYEIVPSAVWSGYARPWQAAPFIRQYMRTQVPALPDSLTACFEPRSASFIN